MNFNKFSDFLSFLESLSGHNFAYLVFVIFVLILWWWYRYNQRIFYPEGGQLFGEDLAARKKWIKNRRFENIYLDWLGRMLNGLTRFTRDREHLLQNHTQKGWVELFFGVQPFTAGSYELCLRLALVYPWLAFFIVWIVSGSGEFSGLQLLPEESRLIERLEIVVTFVLVLWLLLNFFSMLPTKVSAIYLMLAGAVITIDTFAVAVAGAFAFAGAFAVTFAAAFAGAGAVAVAVAVTFAAAVGLTVISAYVDAVTFVVTYTLAVAITLAVIDNFFRINYTTSQIIARYWLVFNCFYLAIASTVIVWLLDKGVTSEKLLFIFFLCILPLINAVMDWLSLGFTRGFLYAICQRTHSGATALLLALFDVILALAFLFLIVSLTVLFIAGINAAAMHWTGTSFMDLDILFDGLAKEPLAQEYTWIHFMMLSTLIPTLIHFTVAGAAAIMIFPNAWRNFILQKWKKRGDARASALWYVTIVPALGIVAPLLFLGGLYALLSTHGGYIGYGLLNWARDLSMVFAP